MFKKYVASVITAPVAQLFGPRLCEQVLGDNINVFLKTVGSGLLLQCKPFF